ncbi:MAG: hypothetical protein V3W04_14080 [Gammaproteobacteria bacterium]
MANITQNLPPPLPISPVHSVKGMGKDEQIPVKQGQPQSKNRKHKKQRKPSTKKSIHVDEYA